MEGWKDGKTAEKNRRKIGKRRMRTMKSRWKDPWTILTVEFGWLCKECVDCCTYLGDDQWELVKKSRRKRKVLVI
jgi:hypothetical protein